MCGLVPDSARPMSATGTCSCWRSSSAGRSCPVLETPRRTRRDTPRSCDNGAFKEGGRDSDLDMAAEFGVSLGRPVPITSRGTDCGGGNSSLPLGPQPCRSWCPALRESGESSGPQSPRGGLVSPSDANLPWARQCARHEGLTDEHAQDHALSPTPGPFSPIPPAANTISALTSASPST